MGLPPLWTLIFLYLGFKVHGISGMILAVPIGIFVMNLYHYGAFDPLIGNIRLLAEEVQLLREPNEAVRGNGSEREVLIGKITCTVFGCQ